GASEKLRKGKTGKEQGQMMPFLCMMGEICRITTQKTEVGSQRAEGRSQRSEVRGQRAEGRGQRAEVRGQKATMADAPELLKFGLKNVAAVNGKSAVEPDKTEKSSFTPVKSGGKNDIGNSLKSLGLKGEAKAVVGKDEAFKESRGAMAFDSVGENLRLNGKIDTATAFLKGGKIDASLIKDVKIDPALLKDGKIDPALLKDGKIDTALLKDGKIGTALLKDGKIDTALFRDGKNAVASDKTEKNSFTLTKNDSGKNEIKNILRNSGLKSGETIETLHRKTSLPSHSDKISSAGAYHHTSFHSGGSSTAVNESVNSSGIEPRTLINQIANRVKIPGRVRITLNPPRLGTLDMDVLVRDNKVHVMLQPENNDVRHVLQSNVESLKSSLRNHGLVADAINVLVQEKSDGADYSANYKSGQNETLFKGGGKREGNEEDHSREQNFLNHNPSTLEEENPRVRSDGRISLFA
ncbi:MAG: flagellar hook-length control protein FliK, partial [Thermodesulfobacteriota bacterium]|nr:flagellar hook-length control protein FliK [Thermodesulfobacteriota bacterium]